MPEPLDSKPDLIFDWRRPRAEWARLFFWMLVTFLGLAAFFALFRVVYPQTQRLVPAAQQITLLGGDPAAQALIKSVQDRDFLIIPATDSARNPISLDDRAPVFHPSYEKHELKLLDLPQRNTQPAPVRLLDVRQPNLPRLDLGELNAESKTAAPAPKHLALKVRGSLGSREIVSQPPYDSMPMSEPESWRFHLGVNGAGQVVFALPLETPGKLDEATPLLRLIRQVRFAADKAGKISWGEVTLAWSPAPENKTP